MPTKFNISYDRLHRDCLELVEQIQRSKIKYDGVIGIARGGLVPATIVAHALDLPVLHAFVASSYQGSKQEDIVTLNNTSLPAICEQKNLLVIDDLLDSGRTIKVLYKLFENVDYCNLDFSAIYVKGTKPKDPRLQYVVNRPVIAPEEWLVFPYEKKDV